MPPLETDCREQDVVYWAFAGVDDYGESQVSAPIDLKVRLELKQRVMRTEKGDEVTVDATMVTNQVILEGSIVFIGTTADFSGTATELSEIKEVLAYSEIPDIKNRNVRRRAGLVAHHDEIPEVV